MHIASSQLHGDDDAMAQRHHKYKILLVIFGGAFVYFDFGKVLLNLIIILYVVKSVFTS